MNKMKNNKLQGKNLRTGSMYCSRQRLATRDMLANPSRTLMTCIHATLPISSQTTSWPCALVASCHQLEVLIAKVKILVILTRIKRRKSMSNFCHQVEWMMYYIYHVKVSSHLLVVDQISYKIDVHIDASFQPLVLVILVLLSSSLHSSEPQLQALLDPLNICIQTFKTTIITSFENPYITINANLKKTTNKTKKCLCLHFPSHLLGIVQVHFIAQVMKLFDGLYLLLKSIQSKVLDMFIRFFARLLNKASLQSLVLMILIIHSSSHHSNKPQLCTLSDLHIYI